MRHAEISSLSVIKDDIWKVNKLERCSAYFDDRNISLIAHSAKTIDGSSKMIGGFRQGINKTKITPLMSYDVWSTFWGFSLVFRREILYITSAKDRFIDYLSPGHMIAHDRWWLIALSQVRLNVVSSPC